MRSVTRFFVCGLWFASAVLAQDTATGAIRGTVGDSGGARTGASSIVLVNAATNFRYSTTTDSFGRFAFELLPPGDYSARAGRRECRPRPRQVCMWM
jgi:protocatechuate 3,4-dioxygenase beta subunit